MNVVFESRIAIGYERIGKHVGLGRKKIKTLSEKEGCPIFKNENGYPCVNVGKFVLWYENYCREMFN